MLCTVVVLLVILFLCSFIAFIEQEICWLKLGFKFSVIMLIICIPIDFIYYSYVAFNVSKLNKNIYYIASQAEDFKSRNERYPVDIEELKFYCKEFPENPFANSDNGYELHFINDKLMIRACLDTDDSHMYVRETFNNGTYYYVSKFLVFH